MTAPAGAPSLHGPPGPTVPGRLAAGLKARGSWRLQQLSPDLWVRLNHFANPRRNDIAPYTDLLVEGYEGSANTYVRAWIHFVNGNLHIASHHHGPGAFAYAIGRGIPTLVLVRDPVDAVASTMSRFEATRDPLSGGGVRRMLRRYVELYRPVLARPSDVVVTTFRVDDPTWLPAVVDRLNERFGTSFRKLPADREHLVVEYLATKDDDPDSAALPRASRRQLTEDLRARITSPRYGRLLADARTTFDRLAAIAGDSGTGQGG